MSNSCVPFFDERSGKAERVTSGKAERMCNSRIFVFSRRQKEETNYRNTHNLSRNGHNIMFICGAITRITRIRFSPYEWILVCDATCNTHVIHM